MISKTFISRPKFALVISIVITIAGLISMALLPVNMYPQITPPQVQISASYPGASAQIVEESVIRPIEEQVNGVEDMMYIESTSSNNGTANITVYFKVGTDTDIAQVNVQNRVALAEAGLPEEVKRQGVSVKKKIELDVTWYQLILESRKYRRYFLKQLCNQLLNRASWPY